MIVWRNKKGLSPLNQKYSMTTVCSSYSKCWVRWHTVATSIVISNNFCDFTAISSYPKFSKVAGSAKMYKIPLDTAMSHSQIMYICKLIKEEHNNTNWMEFPIIPLEFLAQHRNDFIQMVWQRHFLTELLTFFIVTFKVGTNMQYLQQEDRQEPFVCQLRDKLHYSQPNVMFNVIALMDILKFPQLPSILLADVQFLDNNVDELRARMSFQRDTRDCNIFCFTESWLSPHILIHTANWVLSTLCKQE